MSKMAEKKRELKKQVEREVVEEASRRLEQVLELKNQGKEAEGDQVVNEMIAWLEGLLEETEDKGRSDITATFDRTLLPQFGETVAEGTKIVLKVLAKNEQEEYLNVAYNYSVYKGLYKEESFRDEIWREFLSDDSFVCSIYDKESLTFVGYCYIRSLSKRDWELAIELKPEYCHQGYGTEALPLLMKFLHKEAGTRFFRARVEVDNRASQKLMNKLGAFPNGISEFMIHGDDIEKFQREHKDEITEEIRAVAEEFCMDAEDLLGYVLEYRFDMEKVRD